jgi:hypothetical protein
MAGEAGFLARSNNLGESWAALDRPYNGSYFNLLISQDNMMVPSGLRGNVWLSEDQSATWKKLETGNIDIFGGVATDGTDLQGANESGISVYTHSTNTLTTTGNAKHINITGANDLMLSGIMVAGGTLSEAGINWTGKDNNISIETPGYITIDGSLSAYKK